MGRSYRGMALSPSCQIVIHAKRPHKSYHWWAIRGREKMLATTIGGHPRNRRIDLGLEQGQLAEEMGFSLASICNWEPGIYRPTKRAMEGIIALLGDDLRV